MSIQTANAHNFSVSSKAIDFKRFERGNEPTPFRREHLVAATLFLEFGKIEPGDVPLALAVADNERGGVPDGESFGLDDAGAEDLKACRAWGMWVKGSLSGAVWIDEAVPGTARIRALAIGKGWRCTGLLAWMLSELAHALRREGFRNVAVDIFHGGFRLGESLEEAGFSGPRPDDESYPTGAWSYRGV